MFDEAGEALDVVDVGEPRILAVAAEVNDLPDAG